MQEHAERLEALEQLAPTEADFLPWNWEAMSKMPLSTASTRGESIFGISDGKTGFVSFSSTSKEVALLQRDKWSWLPQRELMRSILGLDEHDAAAAAALPRVRANTPNESNGESLQSTNKAQA